MDLTLLMQAVLYFCIFILGFLVCIPVGVNRSNFGGVCPLYADCYSDEFFVYILDKTPANCNFPIYFGVVGILLFGLAAGLCFLYFTLKSRTDDNIGHGKWTLVFLPLNIVLAVFTLVAASMLSAGINVFRDGIEEHGYSCKDFENTNMASGSNTGKFLTLSSLSQGAAWIGFLLYLGQIGIDVLRFYKNRRIGARQSEG